MKSNKIIAIFMLVIIVTFGGYFIYSHTQKVNLAQHYYNIGDYKKASDLKVGDISEKSGTLNSAELWRMDISDDFITLFMTIQYIGGEIEENKNDKIYVNRLKVYYKQMADYFNISEQQLDEIRKTDRIQDGANKLRNI